ncbi:MAG TPA: hypothetical protein VK574_15530 [Terracidiphilus sp.]|nr:hypothetical protein [Terracidiphilus sp.]
MNSPAVRPIAPSTHPALELIALAQLSPEEAGQRLRALLLANPKYFGNIPPTSFNAVLKIQEDTTYECISSVAYDAQFEQLRATIDIKQTVGYSGVAQTNGSEEFVRFFVSYDGGAKWLDQGMRSVNVSDALVPRPLAYEVILQIVSAGKSGSPKLHPKVRAILSWNSPPPAGAPTWIPVWGNVLESDMEIKDSRVSFSMGMKTTAEIELPQSTVQATKLEERSGPGSAEKQRHVSAPTFPSSKTDPQHRFLAYFFARAARHTLLGSPNPAFTAFEAPLRAVAAPSFPIPNAAEARFAAAL